MKIHLDRFREIAALPYAARTGTGNSAEFSTESMSELDAAIKATADTAITTLNACVQAYDSTINDWVTIGAFTEIVATPSVAEGINVTTGLRKRCRVHWVIVGTSVTFAVGVYTRQND